MLCADRGENDPLIVAGGPCAYNPEPLADFIDVFLIGVRAYTPNNESAPKRVRRAIVKDIENVDFPVNNIIPFIETVHDRAVVETFRGCTRGCRFCQAGMIYRPVRERSKDRIIDIAKKQLENTGHEELSLLSL